MELIKAIAMRKSTRSYKPEQISEESLNTIINAGCSAPIGMGAYNSVNITVIQNLDMLDRISKTAATDAGIGSVYMLSPLSAFNSDKELIKELNLPEGFVPAAGIALGYPTEPLTQERELKQKIKVNTIK